MNGITANRNIVVDCQTMGCPFAQQEGSDPLHSRIARGFRINPLSKKQKQKRHQQTGSKAGSDRAVGMGPTCQQSRSEPSLALEKTDNLIRTRLARPDRPWPLATAKGLRCNDGVATAPHESVPMQESTRMSQRRSVMGQTQAPHRIDPTQTPIRCIDTRRRLPRARCTHCCGGHGLTHPK